MDRYIFISILKHIMSSCTLPAPTCTITRDTRYFLRYKNVFHVRLNINITTQKSNSLFCYNYICLNGNCRIRSGEHFRYSFCKNWWNLWRVDKRKTSYVLTLRQYFTKCVYVSENNILLLRFFNKRLHTEFNPYATN